MFINLLGDKIIERKFEHVAATRSNMRKILGGPVADVIFEIEEQIFNSQGRRGGGSWAMVTPGWFDYKRRHAMDLRIGHARMRLRHAMTERGAQHQVFRVTSQSLTMGTNLPYAAVQQRNRPFIKFLPRDRQEIVDIISNELHAAWKRG